MNWKQIIGVECKHRRLSWPISGHRCCTDCGEPFKFTTYDVDPGERHIIDHYTVSEPRSIKRVGHSVLKFKQRKEGNK